MKIIARYGGKFENVVFHQIYYVSFAVDFFLRYQNNRPLLSNKRAKGRQFCLLSSNCCVCFRSIACDGYRIFFDCCCCCSSFEWCESVHCWRHCTNYMMLVALMTHINLSLRYRKILLFTAQN